MPDAEAELRERIVDLCKPYIYRNGNSGHAWLEQEQQAENLADALLPLFREARVKALREAAELRRALEAARDFLKDHHRSSAQWFNDTPTFDVVSSIDDILALSAIPAAGDSAEMEQALRDAFPHFQDGAPITPEAIRGIGHEYLDMVMSWEPSKSRIDFADQDGNYRTIEYDGGDPEASIPSGWTIADGEGWIVTDLPPPPASGTQEVGE